MISCLAAHSACYIHFHTFTNSLTSNQASTHEVVRFENVAFLQRASPAQLRPMGHHEGGCMLAFWCLSCKRITVHCVLRERRKCKQGIKRARGLEAFYMAGRYLSPFYIVNTPPFKEASMIVIEWSTQLKDTSGRIAQADQPVPCAVKSHAMFLMLLLAYCIDAERYGWRHGMRPLVDW